MSKPLNERVDELFLAALDVPQKDRIVFLDEQCGDDGQLRNAVMQLLSADAGADAGFLKSGLFVEESVDAKSDDDDRAFSRDEFKESDDSISHSGRFDVLSRHESGGLGEVLNAYDRQLRREVAIKQIKPRFRDSDEARQRFLQEAEVTGRLEHPGVVPVYAMGSWQDGRPYYAMRFIEGRTLRDRISEYHDSNEEPKRRSRSLAFRQLLQCFVDVCNTVSYAHSRDILHRDLKPSNIRWGHTAKHSSSIGGWQNSWTAQLKIPCLLN